MALYILKEGLEETIMEIGQLLDHPPQFQLIHGIM